MEKSIWRTSTRNFHEISNVKKPSVCWTDFLCGFNEFFKLNLKQCDFDESVKSLHDVIGFEISLKFLT